MKGRVALHMTALAAGIYAAVGVQAEGLLEALVWPFEALGGGLRWLSRASSMGNVCAFALYIALALVPAGCFFRLRRRAKRKYDFLWLVLSGYCFFLIYWLVNPQTLLWLLPPPLAELDALPLLQGMVICLGVSILLACVVFRLAEMDETAPVLKQLSALLAMAEWLVVFSIAAFGFSGLALGWAEADSGARAGLILKAAAGVAPQAATVAMLEAARAMLRGMRAGWFQAQNIPLADRLAKAARFTLHTSLWCMLAGNALQLAFSRTIPDVNIAVQFPLFELAAALTALILARYVSAGCAVKRENDLMI